MACVDRCVCHNLTFVQLKEIARDHGHDFDRLMSATGCGESCGMCRQYIEKMLQTGETRFAVIPRSARVGLNIVRPR